MDQMDLRLDGVYQQRQPGYLMQRIKLPAGVISSAQARAVSDAAERFGRSAVHLTTRCSMELHWLTEADLPAVKRHLMSVGLTSRGACGGAVRGITCGSGHNTPVFSQIEELARRLQRHFTGNPYFERLPKKFKIGIEAGIAGKRHIIQDVGLVHSESAEGHTCYDMYVAGGLGREPRPGFLLKAGLPEERIIPIIEAVLRVYSAGTPPGKRLKHLVVAIGEDELRRRIEADITGRENLPIPLRGLPEAIVPPAVIPNALVEAHFFTGQVSSTDLRTLAALADISSDGALMVTADQNIQLPLAQSADPQQARLTLAQAGLNHSGQKERVTLRVCPGSHECRIGLAPTRDIARLIVAALGPEAEKLTWGISGCPNSCSQPQLADVGIVTSRMVVGEDGERSPRFDLYRAVENGIGIRAADALNLSELLGRIGELG